MGNVIFCFNAVMPILCIMLIGYLARICALINDEVVEKMNKAVFYIFVPIALFYNIYGSSLSEAIQPGLVVFASLGVLFSFLFSLLYTRLFFQDLSQRGVMLQALFRSNYVVVGLPIVSALFVDCNLAAVSFLVAVVVTIFNILAVLSLTIFCGTHADYKTTLYTVITNPVIIGAVVGLLFSALGVRLPTFLARSLGQLNDAVGPIMLFLLGAFFRFDTMLAHIKTVLIICVGRLVLIPAIILSVAYFVGFRGMEFSALIGLFASSTAVTSFTVAQQLGGDGRLAGDIVVLSSIICPFTMMIWCMLFKGFGAV